MYAVAGRRIDGGVGGGGELLAPGDAGHRGIVQAGRSQ